MTGTVRQPGPPRRRMIDEMTVGNLSPATQRSYIHAVLGARGGETPPRHSTGGPARFYRDVAYVTQHGVPEWPQLTGGGKSSPIIGVSTQRQMVKHLSPRDQFDPIQIAKQDKNSLFGGS